ncbi:MAG TPA: hypothetical protein VF890_03580 [Gemmatimonadales bacterium]
MRFAALLALLVAAGIPLLAYLWETLNLLLGGHLGVRRLALSAPLLVVFAALLWFTARSLQRAAAARPGAAPGETEPLIAGTVFLTAFLMMFVFAGWLVVYTVLLHR